jgi:histidinol-phosphate aminotransferase
VEAIVKCAGEVHRYEGLTGGPLPPHLNFLVRQSGAQVIITAGSAQFLSMLGNWIAPGQLVQPWPTFSLLGEATQLFGGTVKNVPLAADYSVDVDALLAAVSAETKAVYLCNPNNPTGVMMPYEQVKRIAESLPETCHLILDEAYYEYAADDQAGYGKLLHDDKLAARLVIVRTFSKIYALAAMRVGFAYTPTTLSGHFVRRLPMYPVNRAGYAAAAAAFADAEHLRKCRDFAKTEREKMTTGLQKLGCKVVPSSATFLLVDTGRNSAQFVTILARKGFFVRPGSDYGYDKMMRVSLGTAKQNEGFLNAVEEAMKG